MDKKQKKPIDMKIPRSWNPKCNHNLELTSHTFDPIPVGFRCRECQMLVYKKETYNGKG